MRVLIVSHYFPPEIGAPQARLSDLARLWTQAGEDVTVLTGMPSHPTGVVPPEYRRKARVEEHVDGYRVVRTWLYATPNEGFVKKTLGHLSFMVTSVVLGARRVRSQDVVVVSSPTFFSIFSAWLIAKLKRAAFVIEIRDLWPAIFIELGVIKNRQLIRVLEWLELTAYRGADAIVVVSDGFRDDLLRRGVPAEKVTTIRNGVDVEQFSLPTDVQEVEVARKSLGATPGDTLVLYIGAHGISHGLGGVVEAARELTGEPIHVAFVGEGAEKAAVERRVGELGLTNVTMRPGVPRTEVPALVAAADICLVPLRGDVELFSTFIPSKMFEFFAAKKAVLGALRGEPAEILRAAGGAVVDPGDSDALSHEIKRLAGDPSGRAAMGARAAVFVAESFDRRKLAAEYQSLLSRIAS